MYLKLLAIGVAATMTVAASAHASTPYTGEAFAAAQAENRPILIDIAADWCPTCRRQGEILGELTAEKQFADLVTFRVDYDQQRDVVRAMRAQRQSTLVVFRGTQETGRAVGITDEDEIERLLQTAYDR